jgi:hypothetical protein
MGGIMSIVLQGSTSGSVTLQEPAVAGTTVLTLPAVSGNVLTDTSPKAGNVIQVVSATNSTQTSITGTSFADTSLTASITPTSSSSKILVLVYQPYRFTDAANGGGIIIVRNSTPITTVLTDTGNAPYQLYLEVAADFYGIFAASYLDSPATTSSTVYKTQSRPYLSAGSIVLQAQGNVNTNMSTITLMEIAA